MGNHPKMITTPWKLYLLNHPKMITYLMMMTMKLISLEPWLRTTFVVEDQEDLERSGKNLRQNLDQSLGQNLEQNLEQTLKACLGFMITIDSFTLESSKM